MSMYCKVCTVFHQVMCTDSHGAAAVAAAAAADDDDDDMWLIQCAVASVCCIAVMSDVSLCTGE